MCAILKILKMSRMECGSVLGAKRRSKWFCAEENLLCAHDPDDVMRFKLFKSVSPGHKVVNSALHFSFLF